MSSLIIVESHNDKFFIEKLRDKLNLVNIKIENPICNLTDYECLDGLSEKKLSSTLLEVKFDKYKKIGIIIDADNVSIENRISLVNKCVKSLENIPNDFNLTNINQLIRIEELDIEIGCYITNVDGKGELDTVLKTIANQDSTFADCLNAWKSCLESKGKSIKEKDFIKFWVNNYLRFDTCKKSEQSQANSKCKNEQAIKKDIWNLDDPILNDLKEFLKLLS
jgi:hypothetical protein